TSILLGGTAPIPGPGWAEQESGRVHRGEATFAQVVETSGRRLDLGGLVYFARWITPEAMPKRYDTAFFAAAMPEGQEARPAAGEVQSLEWLTPAEALARAEAGAVML